MLREQEAHAAARPTDPSERQLTVRAVVTGMVLGATLSLCNIYSGLKIGWSNNMSITAALLAFAFWRALAATGRTRPFGLYENNLNQTGASAGALISSAGLVAPIPALTILTGTELSWGVLALWTFSVTLVGNTVAVALRRQLLLVDKLPFPSGIATAETLREMHAAGGKAVARVGTLVAAGVVAAGVKAAEHLRVVGRWALPAGWTGAQGEVTLRSLTFAADPTLLMVGAGALVGLRGGASLLLGALVAYGVLAPIALERGWATAGAPGGVWFVQLNRWLLWPGVALMVSSSLTSFAFSWRSFGSAFRSARGGAGAEDSGEVSRRWLAGGAIVALVLSTTLQVVLFDVFLPIAALGVVVSFLVAVVAARVSGETNVTPVGAMGKITQLLFGFLAPGQVAPNLMAANVTGGAASQCADLMHDLKTGHLIGAVPRYQVVAQVLGALAGALAGSAAYLVLVPDPKAQLLTEEWPAPAVATWKAVAELFATGFVALPGGAGWAIVVAGAAGIALAIAEKLAPARVRALLPSASALGLAFILPAYNSMSMFAGALLAAVAARVAPRWSAAYAVVVAAGLIAGESLAGVGIALESVFAGASAGAP